MRVVSQREVDIYEEKVTIEFTLRELTIIGASVAGASTTSIRNSLGGHLINLLDKDSVQASDSDNASRVYEELLDILREKGVFR